MKTKFAKKPLACLAVLAITTGICGVCALNHGNPSVFADADTPAAIEFTATDSLATNSELVTNVDVDGNGVVDVESAWKIDLTKSYGAITFNTPIDLSGAKGIQLRMYIHWSPDALSSEDLLCVHKDAITDQAWAGSIWAFWRGVDQADRPVVQDQWITFTITDQFPLESLSKLSIVPVTSTGRTVYEDAYILVDKITAIKDGDTVNGANVVTEFGADQVSHAGQGWRSDLVTEGDGCSHGATTAWKAKATGTQSVSFPEVNLSGLYGNNLKGVQIRMYAHLGEITGDTNIEVQLNGETKGHWASEASGLFDTTRPIVQDQWITYTIAEGFSMSSLSKLGFVFPASGINYHDDAYILVDKITTITDTAAMDENVVTEFAADQISQSTKGWRTDLLVDGDVDNDGTPDVENAWRINLDTGVASTGITFANPIDLSAYAGVQFRVYVHWGTNFGAESKISFCQNTAKPGNEYDGVFALWKGSDQADRPMKQDEWITFTVAENLPTTSLSALGIYIIPDGVTAYDDAYMLIDKVVGVPKQAATLGEDVVTEFAANEISHSGQGWRTDLVTDMDENNQGVDSAFRMDVKNYTKSFFKLATPYALGDDVEAIQLRMYLHLGELNGAALPAISLYANDSSLTATDENQIFVYWSGNAQHQWFRQNEWLTLTINKSELSKFNGSLSSIGIKVAMGGTAVADDAYILIDNITVSKTSGTDDGVLTDFAPENIDNTGKGWRVDMEKNIDTDGDGVVDAENAYRLNYSVAAGIYPSFDFANAIDLSNVKSLHLRLYVHWGTIAEGQSAAILLKTKNGATEADFIYLDSNSTLKQDEWLDIYVDAAGVAGQVQSLKTILAAKIGEANVDVYDNAYILFDVMYENKYVVTFDKGGDLGEETFIRSEGQKVSALASEKVGYTVEWFVDEACTQAYDFNSEVKSDMTLYAKYSPIPYTVTFKHGDTTVKEVTANYDATVAEEASEQAGYTVVWYTDADCTQPYDFNTLISGDLTLYGKYTIMTFRVTFMNGENKVKVESVDYGNKVAKADSDQEGYTVVWYTDAACENAYDFETPISGELTLYGGYTIKTFTVTFNHPDGYEDKSIVKDWNTTVSEDCEEAACQEVGKYVAWYVDEACTQAYDFNAKITADIVIYAKYTTNLYTVTFEHGEAFGGSKVQKVEHGSLASEQASSNEAYTVAWYKDAECTEPFDFNTPITGNVTVYAKYTIKTFTVTFRHGAGMDDEVAENVEYGSNVEAKASKKTGYTVVWYVDEACEIEFNFETAAIKTDVVLYAKYTAIPYTVTFMHGETVVKEVIVNYDATVAEEASEQEGYTVVWYVDEACTTAYDFNTPISGDLTLYGKYTIIQFTVTFRHESGAVEVKVDYGTTATAAESLKTGYTVEWYLDEACKKAYDFNGEVKSDITLYAKYTAIPYTVTFKNGETTVKEVVVNYDATVAEEASEQEGYTVVWYTDAACTNAYDFNTPISGDLTLYGGYTIITFTVTFHHEDGVEEVKADYGTTVSAAASRKEGYSVKWYVDEACTEAFDFDAPVKSDCQLYPVYKIRTYTVTFHYGEGVEAVSVKVEYGQKATAGDSKKPGHTVEWYVDEACTKAYDFESPISGNLALYAKYTVIKYTVTFVHGNGIEDVSGQVAYNEKAEAAGSKKDGYTVTWYIDEERTEEFDFDTPITGDITLYAVYTLIETSSPDESSSSDETSSSDEDSSSHGGFDIKDILGGSISDIGKLLGCNSTVGAVTTGALVAIAGALLLRKKKDDDEK